MSAPGAAVWWAGARPRTLPASVTPVLVGTAAAGHATPWRTAGALIVGLGMQVGVNYANDRADAVRGVDSAGRAGPLRITASGLASPRAVGVAATVAFGVAAAAGLALAVATDLRILAIGAAAIGAAVLYSGGPRPYGARGLGEIAVFIFFGLAATCGTAYVQAGRVPVAAWWAAFPVGFLAVAILVANNLRDVPTDSASGKRTLAVRIGDRATRALYRGTVLAALAVVPAGVGAGALPSLSLLALGSAPLALRPLAIVGRASGRHLVPAIAGTAALQATFGVLLALGMWWA